MCTAHCAVQAVYTVIAINSKRNECQCLPLQLYVHVDRDSSGSARLFSIKDIYLKSKDKEGYEG